MVKKENELMIWLKITNGPLLSVILLFQKNLILTELSIDKGGIWQEIIVILVDKRGAKWWFL